MKHAIKSVDFVGIGGASEPPSRALAVQPWGCEYGVAQPSRLW
jgi:hypothetical protein